MESQVDPAIKDHSFFANACQICRAYGKDVKLKICGNCKTLRYCSKEHQIEHWPKHKEFCRALSKAVKFFEPITKNYTFVNSMDWKKVRIYMTQMIEFDLGRPLSYFELELVVFPRACKICYESDPRKLSDCPDCPDASFCINHPRDSSHHAECETSKLHFETKIMSVDFTTLPHLMKSHYGTSPPKNMEEAVELFVLNEPGNKSIKAIFAMTSSILTRPYTFLYSLEQLSYPKLPKTTIHVIARNAKDLDFLDFWHIFFHHDLPFTEFKIVAVGPELSANLKQVDLCVECLKKGCKINIQSVRALYSDFVEDASFTRPDYVIGFNVALLDDDPLMSSIKVLARLNCPFIVTTYIAKETASNVIRISSFLGKMVEPIWIGKNPFSSLEPHKEFEMDGFFYHNQYLVIYDTLA
ncbi:uncharacterized protein [Venturia canescens]|uniref:uncharacterized protein n=1 Tax=Venturia canescens TaxID=32260 RepID=UPI001C9C6E1A|nr:uncharacterized protein LOC122407888 [Venturia canescens]